MTIWKNTCGGSWQGTIENGGEVSGKPGAFLFFIPKGALTHHLLKQAVVALPLVGHVRSPRGIAAPAGAAGSCSRMLNEYDGVQHDYTRKQGLGWRQVFLPATAPAEWQDRETLWNAVEETETAKDSRLAREFVAALPIELSREEQTQLLQDFIKEQFVADGMCADAAIHDPYPPGHNPHAHILLTVRPLDEKGKWQYKTEKEYLCAKDGKERGFTAAEFKQAQTDGWEKQYQYKVGKKKVHMTPSAAQAQGYERVSKYPKSTKYGRKIPSRNDGTATSSLFCGGLHGQMWQTAIWSALDMRNASTTAAMPSVACWSGLRSMKAWLPELWRKRVLSLTDAS